MKQKLKTAAEYDWTGAWRRLLCYTQRAGVGKSIKRQMNKRFRKQSRVMANEEIRRMIYNETMENHQ